MGTIGIEVNEYESESFVPNADHVADYNVYCESAYRPRSVDGSAAVATAILALAAQMARIADAFEFVVKENV